MPDPWYRTWRYEERAYDERLMRDVRFRRHEAVKRVLGDLCIIGAIVAFGWSMVPG